MFTFKEGIPKLLGNHDRFALADGLGVFCLLLCQQLGFFLFLFSAGNGVFVKYLVRPLQDLVPHVVYYVVVRCNRLRVVQCVELLLIVGIDLQRLDALAAVIRAEIVLTKKCFPAFIDVVNALLFALRLALPFELLLTLLFLLQPALLFKLALTLLFELLPALLLQLALTLLLELLPTLLLLLLLTAQPLLLHRIDGLKDRLFKTELQNVVCGSEEPVELLLGRADLR